MRSRNPQITDLRTVTISSLVSFFDVLINFIGAAITGSSVMVSQGLQGLADFITTLFLLLGVRRSKRKATPEHPLGHGRELFFWVLLSSLVAFLFSGGLALYLAIQQLLQGYDIDYGFIAFAILLFGFITNGYALSNSLGRLSSTSKGRSLVAHLRYSSLVETKMTLLVDLVGTISAAIGLGALVLYFITGNTTFDAIGAIFIALLTMLGALFVILDLYDLIIGRSPHPSVVSSIREAAESIEGVQQILDIRITTIGSNKLFVILKVHFEDDIDTDEIEIITDKIQQTVSSKVPSTNETIVEAETP